MSRRRCRIPAQTLVGAMATGILLSACSSFESAETRAREDAAEMARTDAEASFELAQAAATGDSTLSGQRLLDAITSALTKPGMSVFAGVVVSASHVELDVAFTSRGYAGGIDQAQHVARLCVRIITGDKPDMVDVACDSSLPADDPDAGQVESTVSLR